MNSVDIFAETPDYVLASVARIIEEVELAPGETRHLTFDVLVPEGYQGDVTLKSQVTNEQGTQAETPQMSMVVGGVSLAFRTIFAILAVVAVIAIIAGTLLYFRSRKG